MLTLRGEAGAAVGTERRIIPARGRDRDGKPFHWACDRRCGMAGLFVLITRRVRASGTTTEWRRDLCRRHAGVAARRFGLEVPAAAPRFPFEDEAARPRRLNPRTCRGCGEVFRPSSALQRYGSEGCKALGAGHRSHAVPGGEVTHK